MNLNELKLNVEHKTNEVALTDYSSGSRACAADVHFRDLRARLLELIESHEVVVGCVAWLTDPQILKALSKRPGGVRFLVQKEDFLRPDANVGSLWTQRLRALYGRLRPCNRWRFEGTTLGLLSTSADVGAAVRCIGNHNSSKSPAFPRMHNKFAVFGNFDGPPGRPGGDTQFLPQAVWTGSFNWTNNSSNSLENAVVIRDSHIADAYTQEFAQLWGLSEELDWATPWSAPEFRIGS